MADETRDLPLTDDEIGALLFAIQFTRFEHPNLDPESSLYQKLTALRERLTVLRGRAAMSA